MARAAQAPATPPAVAAALSRRYGVWLLAIAIAVVLPWIFSGGAARTVISQMGVAIIFALSYNMLLGQGGMLSFGHAVYFGLAGFCVVHIIEGIRGETIPEIPLWLLPLAGGLFGMFFGCVIGYVSTRRSGTIFAMISLGFGEMATAMVLIIVAFFGGEEGIQTNRAYTTDFFGMVNWTRDIQVYYLIVVWAGIATAAMYAFTRTPLGRISNAVRDNPERVAFVGYNTQRVRWIVFTLAGLFAGIAGGLHSISFEQAGFGMINIERSGSVLIMAFIGGAGHFAGPIIGAVLITGLEKVITDVSQAWPVYLGLFFMIVIMFSPGGIAGILQLHERIWKVDWRLTAALTVPYAKAVGASILVVAGAVILIELTHTATSAEALSHEISLFWIPADTTSPWPWALAAGLLAVGVWLCKLTYPGARDAYDTAMKTATDRVLK